MIEILSKEDIQKVPSKTIQMYLIKSFDRLPEFFEYPKNGYFIIIESIDDLIKDEPIQTKLGTFPSTNEFYLHFEMIEEDIDLGVKEILLLTDTSEGFGFSLIGESSVIDEVVSLAKLENSIAISLND